MRQKNYHRIQRLHGTIQLLDVAYPVEINNLYVEVNILSEPTSYNYSEIEDLLQDDSQEINVEYSNLHSAIKEVESHSRLMVLGKPGAGKSTFLQHVIIECNNGNLLNNRVPILIKLRDYARKTKREKNFDLKLYIYSYLKNIPQQEVEILLEEGRVFVLLDGLDEIPEANMEQVIDEISYLIEDYTLTRIIITCRIKGHKYKFDGFTYVEIDDFREAQIIAFAENWFAASYNNNWENNIALKKGKAKAQKFISQLKLPENKRIFKLVTTPLLLSLICKIFSVKHKFYSKRHKLYEQGIEILLSKWDESRRIKRDGIYQYLNLEKKVKLLGYIAYRKFEQEQYILFEKREIKQYISEYLDISEEDSQEVLDSIIQQHGLLIPKAQSIYSFSHLTFQEYFAAKWFVNYSEWQKLIIYSIEEHWKEIFLLVAAFSKIPNELLKLIEEKGQKYVESPKLQALLNWADKIIIDSEDELKFPAKRAAAIYIALDIPLDFGLVKNIVNSRALARELAYSLGFSRTILPRTHSLAHPHIRANRLKKAKIFKNIDFNKLDITLRNIRTQVSNKDQSNNAMLEAWFDALNLNLEQVYLSDEEAKDLENYLYINLLIVNLINSSNSLNNITRKKIEKNLLLPIAEIEKRKQSNS